MPSAVGVANEQTKLTMRMIFPLPNAREFVIRDYHAFEGGQQTIERLAEYLASV